MTKCIKVVIKKADGFPYMDILVDDYNEFKKIVGGQIKTKPLSMFMPQVLMVYSQPPALATQNQASANSTKTTCSETPIKSNIIITKFHPVKGFISLSDEEVCQIIIKLRFQQNI